MACEEWETINLFKKINSRFLFYQTNQITLAIPKTSLVVARLGVGMEETTPSYPRPILMNR